MTSLRSRLLVWLLPATFLVAACASVGSLWGAAYSLAQLLDEQLRYVAAHIHAENGQVSVDETNEVRRHLGDDHADAILTQVWQGEGLTYSSDPSLHMPIPRETGLHDVDVDGRIWHSFVIRQNDRMVQVAQAQDARWEALARIAVNLVWPITALLPVLGICLWVGIGRGLRPLHEIASELTRRDASSWDPIQPRPLPGEVKPLVDALNGMLQRLERAFVVQGEFIADASHELRTPTMALGVHVELARNAGSLAEREAALGQVRKSVERIHRLVHQLLTLARIAPGGPAELPERVELGRLCRVVIVDQLPAADAKNQQLSLDIAGTAEVVGDAANLEVLVRNLVDNAIRYAPCATQIEVRVRSDVLGTVLEVIDQGPGIAGEDRTRVFDRFYRGTGNSQLGSGLGLAIVKRVADEHGAHVQFDDASPRRGLRVRVHFPRDRSNPGCGIAH